MRYASSLLATILLALPALGGDEEEPLVEARVVLEREALVPGEEAVVGVTYAIAPEWHLYWVNPGDSGLPIGLDLDLPAGVEQTGEVRWPAPHRLVLPGDLLNYAYEERVTLLVPVRVAADAVPGEHPVRGRTDWLVCREACLMGEVELAATLRIAPEPGPETADGPLIAAARARLPRAPESGELEARWEGRTLVLAAPGAERLVFFPRPEPAPERALEQGATEGAELRLDYPAAAAAADAERVAGVLTVERPDGTTHLRVELPGPRVD